MTPLRSLIVGLTTLLATICLAPGEPAAEVVARVSVASDGSQVSSGGSAPALSADGRIVAFESTATTLDGRCANGLRHVFVHDRVTRRTTCVSVSSSGAQGDAASSAPALSASGRIVAFVSSATNLVPSGCTGGASHVLAHDRVTATTSCVSVASNGAPGNGESVQPAVSASGLVVAFASLATNLDAVCANGRRHVFVRDRFLGATACVSLDSAGTAGNADSAKPAISASGFVVAFQSLATNLASPCTNAVSHIFIRDRAQAMTICASVTFEGSPGNAGSVNAALAGGGGFVAFESVATNLGNTPAAVGVCDNGVSHVLRRSISISSSASTFCASAWLTTSLRATGRVDPPPSPSTDRPSRSSLGRPTWLPGTAMARPTSSSRAPKGSGGSPRPAALPETAAASGRRSAPMDGSWLSSRAPPTWSRPTPTPPMTYSSGARR